MTENRGREFTSKVIPSEVEESRCETVRQFRGLFDSALATLRMSSFGQAQRS